MSTWQKEFKMYLPYTPCFIFEGETLDKQFVKNENGTVALLSFNAYLIKELRASGYETIVFFNHVRGFYDNSNGQDIARFQTILKQSKTIADQDMGLKIDRGTSSFGVATNKIAAALSNNEHAIAIVLDLASRYVPLVDHIEAEDHYYFSELFLATQNVMKAKASNGYIYNSLILVTDLVTDLPKWFYLRNPYLKTITVTHSSREDRRAFFEGTKFDFYDYEHFATLTKEEKEDIARNFVNFTEGLKNIELNSVRELMKTEKIPLTELGKAITLYKHGVIDNPWTKPELLSRLSTVENEIQNRVKGQKHAIKHASDVIKRAVYGLSGVQHSNQTTKPRGVMFFAGPTGTGKTELAKALAEWLFGSEEAVIRFDMSEYSQPQSDQKLFGSPTGYVGYEDGGQLTKAVKEKPFSIILFDEIEKADVGVLDAFLQVLEDGRMTDSRGETVFFSNTIIIFTSNLGISRIDPVTKIRTKTIKDGNQFDSYEKYRKEAMENINYYFDNVAGRPELRNRIGDNFIVFEFINQEIATLIMDGQLKKIVKKLHDDNNITLNLSDTARNTLLTIVLGNLEMGGRGVGNTIEKMLINPLARTFAKEERSHNFMINITDFLIDELEVTLSYQIILP